MKHILRAAILTLLQFLCGMAVVAGLYLAYGLSCVGLLGILVSVDDRSIQLFLLAFFGLLTILLAGGSCILALWQIICLLQSARQHPFRREDGRTVLRWLGMPAAALLPLVLTHYNAWLLYIGAAAADGLFAAVLIHFFRGRRALRQPEAEAAS